MKNNKRSLSPLVTASILFAMTMTGCSEVKPDNQEDDDNQVLLSALDSRVGFVECKVDSGLSVLRPAQNESLTKQTLYLANTGPEGTEYASLSATGLKLLTYIYRVEGLGNALSGELAITLTNSDEIYLYTNDVNGVANVTEPCTFGGATRVTVQSDTIEYGPWSDYVVSGTTLKARTLKASNAPYTAYQVGMAQGNRHRPSAYREYGIIVGEHEVVMTGISPSALRDRVAADWLNTEREK